MLRHANLTRLRPQLLSMAMPRSARFASTTATPAPPPPEVELFINNVPVKVEAGSALIQACEKAGADIPRFCYHERLAVAGNCRMCLVEVEKSPKLVASCAMPVMPGMRVHTDSAPVKKAREGVMEFLLENHPLDCPVCDQGGECDLQDQSMRYGADRGRFHEKAGKRAVEDKDLGPLVETTMTRCIQCTRCVRFANEVAGVPDLGTTGRGNDLQIGMYVEKLLDSEVSGNVIDLCPVGALTSKPYRMTSRPWELKKTESIDVLDALGSNIRVDSRGLEIMRILPRVNESVNEEWISDKTRFAYDGLKRQRLTSPLLRKDGRFTAISWPEALEHLAQQVRAVSSPARIQAVAGDLADSESLVALRDLLHRLGSEGLAIDGAPSGLAAVADLRGSYTFNTTLEGVEQADALLLIGVNPRMEGAVWNTRVRKSWLRNDLAIGVVGQADDLKYGYEHIGEGIDALSTPLSGDFAKRWAAAKNPMIVVGSAVTERPDAPGLLASIAKFADASADRLFTPEWNGYNVLQRAAGRVGALDLGWGSATAEELAAAEVVYLLGADGPTAASSLPASAFVVYQGHHGDVGAARADLILPGAAYTEKPATYVNTEGRVQRTRAAVNPPGAARVDWRIIRAASEVLGVPLPYEDTEGVRARLAEVSPTFARRADEAAETTSLAALTQGWMKANAASSPASTSVPLTSVIQDFYQTDPISRASSTMARCSANFVKSAHAASPEAEVAHA